MIKSIKTRKKFITPEKAASFIPIFISAGVSAIIIVFFVIPRYIKSTKVNLELNGLIRKKNDLDNLKTKYKVINQKFEKLNQEKTKIIELVTGTKNLDTLLDKLGEIANKHGIEYVSIVPVKLMNYIENPPKKDTLKTKNNKNKKNKTKDNKKIITDPLLVKGSKKYVVDLTFKAEFVNLLAFLRELEFQEGLILINDIDLKLISQNSNNSEINNPNEKIEVKLSTSFYGMP